jgi:hypothetical protein
MIREFDKEQTFDNLIKIILSAGDGTSISKQIRAYEEAMDFLEKMAQTQFDLGYMKAVEVGTHINSN